MVWALLILTPRRALQEQKVWREKEALGVADGKKKGKDGKENVVGAKAAAEPEKGEKAKE